MALQDLQRGKKYKFCDPKFLSSGFLDLPNSRVRILDTGSKKAAVHVVCEASTILLKLANEPDYAFHRIQDHVNRKVPQLDDKIGKLKKSDEKTDRSSIGVEYCMKATDSFTKAHYHIDEFKNKVRLLLQKPILVPPRPKPRRRKEKRASVDLDAISSELSKLEKDILHNQKLNIIDPVNKVINSTNEYLEVKSPDGEIINRTKSSQQLFEDADRLLESLKKKKSGNDIDQNLVEERKIEEKEDDVEKSDHEEIEKDADEEEGEEEDEEKKYKKMKIGLEALEEELLKY